MNQVYHFAAPGRTEIGGNHTDHQHGCVLAAAVDLQTEAAVTLREDGIICVLSEGYGPVEVSVEDLLIRREEKGTTAALVRGVAANLQLRGVKLRGMEIRVRSDVLPGSGLSSSAAFEVLIANVLNELCGGELDPVELAMAAQWAENTYFGKPCGLMDQTVSALGGLVFLDFRDPAHPISDRVDFDFAAEGYVICIVSCGTDHADLTAEYAAIPEEMGAVAKFFGKTALREVRESQVLAALPELRKTVSDRAILRALHYFREDRRVRFMVHALRNGLFDAFLDMVNESGRSSWAYLQNVIPAGSVQRQEMALALALCESLLKGRGACRVHGGGFAGTVQAFVPVDLAEEFRAGMEAALGKGCCMVVNVQKAGGGPR